MKIICIGNYPPRKCGIATFTENLIKSIQTASKNYPCELEIEIIAMNDYGQKYKYPDIVLHTIRDRYISDYKKMADYINNSNADICLLQHEYGIFGGESGLYLLALLKKLKIPLVTTCHTVLEKPSFHEKEVMKLIGTISSRVVVMSSLAMDFLMNVFDIPYEKIVKIEHGVPDFSLLLDKKINKPQGWENRTVLFTFGLIGRNKGIETVIKALPDVVKKYPEVLYVVLGKTHPHVVKYSGEEYRDYMHGLVKELNIENNVRFLDKYVSEEELMEYLYSADIYITPYVNKAQITSGTLSYAVGAGAAIISTPYWHAEELLADGRGRLFDFGDINALSAIILELLDNPEKLKTLQKTAFNYGLSIAWPKIGKQYLDTFSDIIKTGQKHSGEFQYELSYTFPAFSLTHLKRLSDDTAIIQHSKGCVPDHKEGYCLDDTARALIVTLMAYKKFNDESILDLGFKYLAFMQYMQNKNGSFNNILTFDRKSNETVVSEDACGRAIWALGYLVRFSPNISLFYFALDLFAKATKYIDKLENPRGFANSIIGLYHFLKRFPDNEKFLNMLIVLADKLVENYSEASDDKWKWYEDIITYDNGLLPLSLLHAYEITFNKKYFDIAKDTSGFLEKLYFSEGHLSLVGNGKWLKKNQQRPKFAQQPLDAMAIILLCETFYKITKNKYYLDKMKLSFQWFLGNNDLSIPLYDEETKGCGDGIEKYSINRNQGAESTITYLISWLTVEKYYKDNYN